MPSPNQHPTRHVAADDCFDQRAGAELTIASATEHPCGSYVGATLTGDRYRRGAPAQEDPRWRMQGSV